MAVAERGNVGARGRWAPRGCRVRTDLALFERRLRRRNPILGEASEGAAEAPSD